MRSKIKNLFIAGAHRGGWGVTRSYLKEFPPPPEVLVADPKAQRAKTLANEWNRFGARAIARDEKCEDVIKEVPEDWVVMLSVDNVLPMIKVIRHSRSPLQWQLLGRSTANTIVGFSGTLLPDDHRSRVCSMSLLNNLSPYAIPVSSQHIRISVLNDRVLAFTRKEVSNNSAKSIFELDESSKNGGLRVFYGTQQYPLVVIMGEIAPFREVERRVLEIEVPQLNGCKNYAVAVVLTNQVEVFVLERYQKRKDIKFYTTLGEPVQSEIEKPQVRSVVTD